MSNGIEKFVVGKGWVTDDEKAKVQFETDATVKAGVVRWNANGSVPPKDILSQWQRLGMTFDHAKTLAAYQKDMDKLVKRLRSAPPPDAEQMSEMRAAFGSGKTVVNVLTGRKTYL